MAHYIEADLAHSHHKVPFYLKVLHVLDIVGLYQKVRPHLIITTASQGIVYCY